MVENGGRRRDRGHARADAGDGGCRSHRDKLGGRRDRVLDCHDQRGPEMTRARSPYNPSKVHDQPCLYEIGQVVEYVDLSKREEVSEPQPSDSAFWYCVTTNPNCQARASMDLHSRGFSSFYPKKRQWVS